MNSFEKEIRAKQFKLASELGNKIFSEFESDILVGELTNLGSYLCNIEPDYYVGVDRDAFLTYVRDDLIGGAYRSILGYTGFVFNRISSGDFYVPTDSDIMIEPVLEVFVRDYGAPVKTLERTVFFMAEKGVEQSLPIIGQIKDGVFNLGQEFYLWKTMLEYK